MKRKLEFLSIILLLTNLSFAQVNYWTKVSEEKLAGLKKMERASVPSAYQIMNLDFNAFKRSLIGAPIDTESRISNTFVSLPNSKGELSKFRVFEAPIMEKDLADRYPDIKTYVAIGIDNPTVRLRFSVTLFGLHVMSTSSDEGIYYIDTYTKDLNNYILYNRKNIQTTRRFGCLVEDSPDEIVEQNRSAVENQVLATDRIFRQYRLAMACTIEYAAFHVNAAGLGAGTLLQKKGAVLAAMNVTMNRVNGIYERDMSLRMNLVGTNDAIIFIDSDSFSNDNAGQLINQSQSVITTAIGTANFDIGHTVSTGGGGLAGVGVVCNTTNKARGITGSPSPVGDPFNVDYVSHEIGHQFSAPHTYSGTGRNCTQSNGVNAVEPASGTTIMAYAGICDPNVQSNSDPYFHAVSIATMNTFMLGTNCANQSFNGNNPPAISALTNYTIPRGTAFVLTGSATDANPSASLTYCWEQTNGVAGTNFPTANQTTGPVYRSLNPTTSNKRYFPNFQSVLSGNLTPTWEVTPNVARTLNFALTVRDNQIPTGGQTARTDMTVTVASAGPFVVTSPAANASWNTNSSQTITWNVAGTTANGINTSNVNILLSTDNGVTFSTLLANTANDGTQVVTMPATPAVNCRILVEAVGNIFYAVSPNFSIGYVVTNTCNTYNGASMPITSAVGFPSNQIGTVNVNMTGNVSSVSVFNNLTHKWLSDVVTDLSSPQNPFTFIKMFNRFCGNNDASLNLKFATAGVSTLNCTAGGTTLQTVSPGESLNIFNGQNPQGVWTFRAYDQFEGDDGALNSWSIEICTQTITLSSDSFGLENFSLYPNPNNGNFTIQFTSNSGNEIKVNVHDVRGRQIFAKSYNNNGLFNESLQLNNVQSGVYLVTIQDGARKEVKKIVVQ
jgi:subtilisin-like proprotein convertase family protein